MTNPKHQTPPEVVLALWKDALHKAEVIEKRQTSEPGKLEFYVHYVGFDHRLDEWVSADRISAVPVVGNGSHASHVPYPKEFTLAAADGKPEPEPARRSSKRVTKRKCDDFEGRGAQPSLTNLPRRQSTPPPPTDSTQLPAGLDQINQPDLPQENQEEVTKVRNIELIHFGKYEISTWYYSPYPDDYINEKKRLIVCEYCLKYMKTDVGVRAHRMNCRSKKPPGRVIYSKDALKIYEIDGKQSKLYCQNLCLVAKLFLDNKTLYYDIEGFWFYILTEADERERNVDHIVGYFSKEKISYENFNLACILIFPPHQRKGYGKLLIEFSYELSKHDGKIGSPEKPLSDLGLRGYQSYWSASLLGLMREHRGTITIRQLSQMTSVREEDVIETLARLGLFKYWRKSTSGQREICITGGMMEDAIAATSIKLERMVDVDAIRWEEEGSSSGSNRYLELTSRRK